MGQLSQMTVNMGISTFFGRISGTITINIGDERKIGRDKSYSFK